jgi:uncharacterized protein YueI
MNKVCSSDHANTPIFHTEREIYCNVGPWTLHYEVSSQYNSIADKVGFSARVVTMLKFSSSLKTIIRSKCTVCQSKFFQFYHFLQQGHIYVGAMKQHVL